MRFRGFGAIPFVLLLIGASLVPAADDPFAKNNDLSAEAKPQPAPPGPAPGGSSLPAPPTKNKVFLKSVPGASATLSAPQARRGEVLTWTLTIQIADDWYTYPIHQPAEAVAASKTTFRFPRGEVVFVGDVVEPAAKTKNVTGLASGDTTTPVQYFDGKVVFQRKVVIAPETEPGNKTVKVGVTLIVCNKTTGTCLFPEKLEFETPVTVTSEAALDLDEATRAALATPVPSAEEPRASAPAKADSDVLGFLLSGIFWGAVSLLTPCVFPMIPVTVSYFIKQSEKEHHRPLGMALVYCGTIIGVLTVGAVLLLGVFQAASQHWLTNLVLGGVFIVFALSLLGMYDISLPSGLANFTSSRQGRGGTVGTVFMALTFSIISFSCVAPFLGGFAALVPSFGSVSDMVKAGDYGKLASIFGTLLLGALAFSTTFASPFFFLALFPSLLRKMPRSGAWMNTVKVVMGFLELAAAVKFLRATELLAFGEAQLLTYDLALGLYVALSLLCGLYLLNFFRLPHDHDVPEQLGVPRMLVATLFLALAFYLTPALFRVNAEQRQRPGGSVFAWLDSFLLPEQTANPHLGSLAAGLKEARDKRKLVFVDFTGLS